MKKRRSKKKETDDWLSELHAMHSAVGDYFGEPVPTNRAHKQ